MTEPGVKRRVWVTGAGGLIGSHFLRPASTAAPDLEIIGLTRAELDLLDFAAVEQRFRNEQPAVVIHCAAMTRVSDCQSEPELARQVNVAATRRLVELSSDAVFVLLSTDLVFDGREGAYTEADAPNPLNHYGETKVSAEAIVLRHPRPLIVRTSLNGGSSPTGDRGFNEQLVRTWRDGRTANLYTDEFRSPLAAGVTARAVWELIARGQMGVFHVAGAERLSRFQIGELLAARWGSLHPRICGTSLRQHVGPPRAPDTSLNCAKVRNFLSFALPGFTDWLLANPHESF